MILPALVLVIASCGGGGSFNSGGFDPLNAGGAPGSDARLADTGYRPGDFVKTSIDNAAFFKKMPEGNANADKTLPANTPMKVISLAGSYVKVELDSGEVGFVPELMVIDQDAAQTTLDPSLDGAVQVWPPVGGGYPPVTDPDAPIIPEEIDPDAPEPVVPDVPPLPDDAPTPGLGSEPELPPVPGPVDVTPEPAETEAE
ncbi:MAG: hypothetical protein AAGB14_02755 [Verrucomicrobiota bacterium]